MTVENLKMECNGEIKTLKRTQEKMKMGMKSPTTQLENLRESLTSRMNQADDKITVPRIKQIKQSTQINEQRMQIFFKKAENIEEM